MIPEATDFDVSPISGFLPNEWPALHLENPIYQPWEELTNNLPALIPTRRIRTLIDALPTIPIGPIISDERQLRRAYQCLTFLAHAYIWGESQAVDVLPANIATPLVEVSDILRLPPLATYAGLCLWNFRPILSQSGSDSEVLTKSGSETEANSEPESNSGSKSSSTVLWDFSNLTTINTYTGSIDESWFYLVSIFFEYEGGSCIELGLKTMRLIENGASVKVIVDHLQELAESIDYLGSVMMRMEEHCDPHVFYYRIRPFFAGWNGMSDLGLSKDGVLYGNEPNRRLFAGGSNAQSSLIQFLDILLNVQHFATGERRVDGLGEVQALGLQNGFMNEMRNYMPGRHLDFLEALEQNANIKQYVSANDDNSELVLAYDACLAMLKSFRDKHIQIVTRYIVLQAKLKSKLGSASTVRSGLAKKGVAEKGTGGTSLLPFLKQCRDETGDPAAGSWGKRILTDGVMRLKYSKSNGINE